METNHIIKELNGWIWVKSIYYTARVYMDEVVIDQHSLSVRSNSSGNMLKGRYSTPQQAREAIMQVYLKAQEYFCQCSTALAELHKELDFESGDIYEGDTHGTYNDHSYISFRMDGFDFSFINNK